MASDPNRFFTRKLNKMSGNLDDAIDFNERLKNLADRELIVLLMQMLENQAESLDTLQQTVESNGKLAGEIEHIIKRLEPIETFIAREQQARQSWQQRSGAIATSLTTAGVFSILGLIGTIFWIGLRQQFFKSMYDEQIQQLEQLQQQQQAPQSP